MKKFILLVVVLLANVVAPAHATMIRSVVFEAMLESVITCEVSQGKSKDVPPIYLHNFFNTRRAKTTNEGDTLDETSIKVLDKTFMDVWDTLDKAKKKGNKIDCASFGNFVFSLLNKDLANGEMKASKSLTSAMDNIVKAGKLLDDAIYDEYRKDNL